MKQKFNYHSGILYTVNQLSGGERQRVAIAGALATNLEFYEPRYVTMLKPSDVLAMTNHIEICVNRETLRHLLLGQQ